MINLEVSQLSPNDQFFYFVFNNKRYEVYKGIFFCYSRKYQITPSIQQQSEIVIDFDISEDSVHTFVEACQGRSFGINTNNIYDLLYLSSYWGVHDLVSKINQIIENDETGSLRVGSIMYKIQRHFSTDDEEALIAAHINKYIDDERVPNFPIDILRRLIYSPSFSSIENEKKLPFLKKCLEVHGKSAASIFADLASMPLEPNEVENILTNRSLILQPLPRNLAKTCYVENKRKNIFKAISKALNQTIRKIANELDQKHIEGIDFNEAIEELQVAANLGDSEAEETLSLLFRLGVGVPKNVEKAEEHQEKSLKMPSEIPIECNFTENDVSFDILDQSAEENPEIITSFIENAVLDKDKADNTPLSSFQTNRAQIREELARMRLRRKQFADQRNVLEGNNRPINPSKRHVTISTPEELRKLRQKESNESNNADNSSNSVEIVKASAEDEMIPESAPLQSILQNPFPEAVNEIKSSLKHEEHAESSEMTNDSQSYEELKNLHVEPSLLASQEQEEKKSLISSPSQEIDNENSEEILEEKVETKEETTENKGEINENKEEIIEVKKGKAETKENEDKEEIPSKHDLFKDFIRSESFDFEGGNEQKRIDLGEAGRRRRPLRPRNEDYDHPLLEAEANTGSDCVDSLSLSSRRNAPLFKSYDNFAFKRNPHGSISSEHSKTHLPYVIEDPSILEVGANVDESLEILEKKAHNGDTQSAFYLGVIFSQGMNDIQRDIDRGLKFYEISANGGDTRAMFNLGAIYDFDGGNEIPQDLQKAFEWYEKAANKDDKFAQTNLGTMYFTGNSVVTQDYEKAAELYEKAANQGDSDAQTNLGLMYFFGTAVSGKDEVKAAELFELAAAAGDSDAQIMLGVIYESGLGGKEVDLNRAVELYRKAAEQGNADAQFDLGTMYENGTGVERDLEKVVEWYSRAAQNGNSAAMFNLAVIYQNGIDDHDDDDNGDDSQIIRKDPQKALRYYLRAADENHPDALFNLGVMATDGDEEMKIEKNIEKALEYFQKAADVGCVEALFHLGTLYEDGTLVAPNIMKAVSYYEKASELGDSASQFNLGVLYTNGADGLEADKEKAIMYYKLAAEAGDEDAEYNLQQLTKEKSE